MSTTTFAAIRGRQTAVIRALVPLHRAGDRFTPAPSDEPLEQYAGREGARAAVFRQFMIRDLHDDEPLVYCDMQTVRVAHSMNLDIAYPKDWALYGRENVVSMDDVIRSDFHQIDHAIGLVGNANWLPGQHLCEQASGTFFDVGSAFIHRVLFRLEYERDLTP